MNPGADANIGMRRFVERGSPRCSCLSHAFEEKSSGASPALQNKSNAAKQRGYTLIEVIVAFAILALALTLLLGTLTGAARQVRCSADAGRAALHAQSLLDQTGVGESLQPGHTQGDFENGRYRWAMDVAPYADPSQPPAAPAPVDVGGPQLLQLTLSVQWGDAAGQRLQLRSLRLSVPGALPPP